MMHWKKVLILLGSVTGLLVFLTFSRRDTIESHSNHTTDSSTIAKLKAMGLWSWKPESILPGTDFDIESEAIILVLVRGQDVERRNFCRKSIGSINDDHADQPKIQVLFVFGYNWDTTQMQIYDVMPVQKWYEDIVSTRWNEILYKAKLFLTAESKLQNH